MKTKLEIFRGNPWAWNVKLTKKDGFFLHGEGVSLPSALRDLAKNLEDVATRDYQERYL